MGAFQNIRFERNRRMVIILSLVVGTLWAMMVMYVLFDTKEASPAGGPIVAIHPSSPVAGGSTPAPVYKAPRVSVTHIRQAVSYTTSWSDVQPAAPMQSTSMRLYQTSSASVQHVSGGGATASAAGNTSPSRGIRYAAMPYSGTIYVPVTSNAITAVGASDAEDVSQQKMGAPERRPRMAKNDLPGYNEDPDPDDFDDPIGEVPLAVMALLTIAWAVRVRLRRQ